MTERVKRKIFLILTSVPAIVAFCFAAFSLSPSPVRAEGEQKVVTITGFCDKASVTKIRFYAEGTVYGETYIGKVTATDGNRYEVKLTDAGSEGTKRLLDFDFSVGTLSSPDFFIFPDVFVNTARCLKS